jgi:hypothetical protein
MSKYKLTRTLRHVGYAGEVVEIKSGGFIMLADDELLNFRFTNYFEELPKPKEVKITVYKNDEWYGNQVAIQFPSRQNQIWIRPEELDLLKDAILDIAPEKPLEETPSDE